MVFPPFIPPCSTRRNLRSLCMFLSVSAYERFIRFQFGIRSAEFRGRAERAICRAVRRRCSMNHADFCVIPRAR